MPKPYLCIKCGITNPDLFYKGRKNYCRKHFAEYVVDNKCKKQEEELDEQIDESDRLDSELTKRDEQLKLLSENNLDINKDLNLLFDQDLQLQKDLDFNIRKNNQLENKLKAVIEENKELKKEVQLISEKLSEILIFLKKQEKEDVESVKSESDKSVKFDVSENLPGGSAKKKGFDNIDDLKFELNRLHSLNGSELRVLADKYKVVKTNSTGSGYKRVDVLRKDIKEKLQSWIGTQ